MKKKLFIFRFRGPFWAFLGTPQQPHHHDSCFTSLLHLEVSPTMKLNTWPPFKYQILAKNTQKQPFLGVFWGPFLNAPAQGSKNVTVGFPRFFYTRLSLFQPRYSIFFFFLTQPNLCMWRYANVANDNIAISLQLHLHEVSFIVYYAPYMLQNRWREALLRYMFGLVGAHTLCSREG